MSEYQYYEFLAIDRPLTKNEMAELRALSTRATITSVSFTNIYNWGDFKGDPYELMQRYFDAHVYVANWMTAVFMVRLPIEALPEETAKAMAVPYILDFKATKTHWVIAWSLRESRNYDRFAIESGHGWMARLAPVRDELLRGDMRSLYIGWLVAVTREKVDEDEMEPISISGLGNLTAAQEALAEFLEVDPDLLRGAGAGSPAAEGEEISQEDLDGWIDALPRDVVTAVLKQLLEGKGQLAERSIKNRFAAWERSPRNDGSEAPRRTVKELNKNAEIARQARIKIQERERKRREIKRRKEREAYLKNLSSDFPKAWKSVQKTVARGTGHAYDEACRALIDISEAYALQKNTKRFREGMRKFMADHMRRRALIQRLVKAGIWEDK
jgi:hypothetical protein